MIERKITDYHREVANARTTDALEVVEVLHELVADPVDEQQSRPEQELIIVIVSVNRHRGLLEQNPVSNADNKLEANVDHQVLDGLEVETVADTEGGEAVDVAIQSEGDFVNLSVAAVAGVVGSGIFET